MTKDKKLLLYHKTNYFIISYKLSPLNNTSMRNSRLKMMRGEKRKEGSRDKNLLSKMLAVRRYELLYIFFFFLATRCWPAEYFILSSYRLLNQKLKAISVFIFFRDTV